MRKLISVFLMMWCLYGGARQISPGEAKVVASDFMNSSELRTASGHSTLRPVKAPGLNAEGESPYYVFNRGDNEGFVIISGDDRVPKILGYSDKGSFDVANLPPQLKGLMDKWDKQIVQIPVSSGQHPSWSNARSSRVSDVVLLETVDWGQYAPFNDLCPTIEGQKAPTGCVATAMAIAMKYHNWPDSTRGGLEYDYYFPDETFDFDGYSIDWDALSDEDNPDFADQAARLSYSAGVATQMAYGPIASAAVTWTLGHLLQFYYAYDKDCQVVPRGKFDDLQWHDMLKNQLEEYGPVIYYNGDMAHCFIVDGYDTEEMYHINWGWSGSTNGYFMLDPLPEEDILGESQGMVINMRPDKEKKIYSRAWIPNCESYIGGEVNGWNFMEPYIKEGEPNTFKAPSICISAFRGWIGLGIVDENDNIKGLVENSFMQQDGFRYYCSFPGTPMFIYNNLVLPHLNEGERYQLISQEEENLHKGEAELENGYYPANPPSENPADWVLVLGGINHNSYFTSTGNRSDVADIRFHVDESIPGYFTYDNVYGHEFTMRRLKGGDGPQGLIVPRKGISFDIQAADKDGNPIDALYVGGDEEYPDNYLGLNISVYADQFDVYVKYEFDGDTRKDGEVSANLIVENEGLVYKKVETGLELIGYDNVGETVIIPASINVEGIEMPVTSIASEALMHAPIKHLTVDSPYLRIGVLAMASMNELETFSTKSFLEYTSHPVIFTNSSLKTVFLDEFAGCSSVITVTTGLIEYNDRLSVGVQGLDYVVTKLPYWGITEDYFNELSGLVHFAQYPELFSAFGALYVPGFGGTAFDEYTENLPFNIKQMWKYEVDMKNARVNIGNMLDDVKIESVFINGVETVSDEDGNYWISSPSGNGVTNDMEVTVNYTFKGQQKSTVYSSQYNSIFSEEEEIVPVESIQLSPESWSCVEGESFKIEAIVLPENATDKSVIWTSSNDAIATVDSEGNVMVMSEGTCVITAAAIDGSGVFAECVVTSSSEVEGIFTIEDSLDVYDLNGLPVVKEAYRDYLKTLTPGTYIVRQGTVIRKLVIR